MRIDNYTGWITGLSMKNKPDAQPSDPSGAYGAGHASDAKGTRSSAHVQADARNNEAEPEREKTAFERISEVGFSKFVAQLEVEKLEKLREKILQSMGLSEEDLSNMSSEQRDAVEKLVAEEMKRRMAAASIMNSEEQQSQQGAYTQGKKALALPFGNLANDPIGGSMGNASMGLGPLLALQAVTDAQGTERAAENAVKPGQNDRDDS